MLCRDIWWLVACVAGVTRGRGRGIWACPNSLPLPFRTPATRVRWLVAGDRTWRFDCTNRETTTPFTLLEFIKLYILKYRLNILLGKNYQINFILKTISKVLKTFTFKTRLHVKSFLL